MQFKISGEQVKGEGGGGGMGEGAPPYLHSRDFSPRKGYLTHKFY